MSIQAAKHELDSLTDFQTELHVTDPNNEDIISIFYRAFIRSTWYSSMPIKLKCTTDGEETIYAVNNNFHFLLYSYMRTVLPAIRVKPDYVDKVHIAWCHNIGTNIIQQAVFKEDDDTYHTWDNVWADIYFQFYQDAGAGKRENHNIGIGNVKCLEDWTSFLPRYPLNVDQPWFYSMDHAKAFPIHVKHSLTKAEHRYTYRTRIGDLLRVEYLAQNGVWKPTTKNLSKYLDMGPDPEIKTPELWGRYAYVTEQELKYHRECLGTRHYYTRDVEICDTQNPNKYKSTAEINLHCVNPCLAFFWIAENMVATASHNYSNYTTDTKDLYNGFDPIKTTTLKYGTITRFDNMPSDHFSIAEPRKHFTSAPNERGYHGYSYAWNSASEYGDIGIVFAGMNAKLFCRIANNNIYNDTAYEEDEEEEEEDEDDMIESPLRSQKMSKKFDDVKIEDKISESNPSFTTRSRLLVIRKFTIEYDKHGKGKFLIK